MFNQCNSLNEVTVHFQAWQTYHTPTNNWLGGVSASGTFNCPTALGTDATIQRDSDHCPTGWTVVNI